MITTVESTTVEPDCTEWDHDWCNPHHLVGGSPADPGRFGSLVREVCARCGCGRNTDDQGLTTYEPDAYDLSEQELDADDGGYDGR